jgi:hypothetical protein
MMSLDGWGSVLAERVIQLDAHRFAQQRGLRPPFR